jgi:hypothetical protein
MSDEPSIYIDLDSEDSNGASKQKQVDQSDKKTLNQTTRIHKRGSDCAVQSSKNSGKSRKINGVDGQQSITSFFSSPGTESALRRISADANKSVSNRKLGKHHDESPMGRACCVNNEEVIVLDIDEEVPQEKEDPKLSSSPRIPHAQKRVIRIDTRSVSLLQDDKTLAQSLTQADHASHPTKAEPSEYTLSTASPPMSSCSPAPESRSQASRPIFLGSGGGGGGGGATVSSAASRALLSSILIRSALPSACFLLPSISLPLCACRFQDHGMTRAWRVGPHTVRALAGRSGGGGGGGKISRGRLRPGLGRMLEGHTMSMLCVRVCARARVRSCVCVCV